MLLCALLTYDPKDLPGVVTTAPNNPLNNWIGPVGARLGLWLFWAFGLTAYMIPALLMMFALGCLVGFVVFAAALDLGGGFAGLLHVPASLFEAHFGVG